MMHDVDNQIINHVKSQQPILDHNEDVLKILEGDLLTFVEDHLFREFSEQAFASIKPRISPINFLKRIVDKLSKIYQQQPQRIQVDGNDSDQELIDAYVESFQMNSVMNVGNEFFNSFKTNLNEVYLDDLGFPKLRAIPNHLFTVYSTNKIDPTVPTHVVIPKGKKLITVNGANGKTEQMEIDQWKIFSDSEAYVLDSTGNRFPITSENPEMINPFGTLPFMYANRSRSFLIPPPDTDTKRMSILLPVLMSDLNYAVKYQVASIIFTIDADTADLKINPNAVWMLKSDPTNDKKPEVGQIKPQVDIQQVISLITTQLSMWLNSRNIRPGSLSDTAATDPISGISKLVDEMDTSDERKKQVEVYKSVEQKFWLDLIRKIHPVWLSQGLLTPELSRPFSNNVRVEVNFPEQLPMIRRGQAVIDLKTEFEAGFISRESAMKKLNPDWTEQRLDEEIEKIDGAGVVVEDDEPEIELENNESENESLANGAATAN